MDILPSLVLVLVGFAIVGWIVSPGTARGLDRFTSGFLPYRGPGWPQGVQEEDPVPWSWSSAKPGAPAKAEGAETIEISRAAAPKASALGALRVVRGVAARPR